MSHEDSLELRQGNEFEALQGIYGEDLRDLRVKRAWNRWSPLNLSISLTPQRGSSGNGEVNAKVDLHVVCSERYPNEVPSLYLEKVKGLSQTYLDELKKHLNLKTQEYKGEVMIFQLCQHVEEFLHQHNKPAMKSFYHQMVLQEEEKKREEEQQRKLEEDRQRETMMREVQQREELLKAEMRQRKERQKSVSETETEEEVMHRRTSFIHKRYHNSGVENNDQILCNHKGTFLLNFGGRTVQTGRCLRHSEPFNITFTGIDKDSGELVEVSEWNLEAKNLDSNQLLRNVASIEQELNYLTKLRHLNLANYLGLRYGAIDGDKVVIHVLKEFVRGSSCFSLFSSQNLKVEIDYLKHLSRGILTALDYIHRNNVVHKNLQESCIFMNERGIVKVADYSIHRRLLDLIQSTHGTYSKKTDIHDFGCLVLRLLGHKDDIEVPNDLPSDLYDLLSNCLTKDEKERYTANQLLNHSFFHKPIVHFSPHHLAIETPNNRLPSPEITLSTLPSQNLGQSRISSEFEILENLGKGAFGDVLKARNKLDSGYYAIKKIKLSTHNKANKKKILREVTLLSKLNHENIVRYYNSWIETTTIKGDVEQDSNFTTTTTHTSEPPKGELKVLRKDEFTLNDDIEAMAPPMKNVEISITYDSKAQVAYEESSDDSSDDDEEEEEEDSFTVPLANRFGNNSDSDSIQFEHASDEDEFVACFPEETSLDIDEFNEVSSVKQTRNSIVESLKEIVREEDYLYIQMEFCEKSTLRTAIDHNLYEDEDRVWRLFREMVDGLAHIHTQGMIHRDLKPVNIFLDSNDHVKIGDFGLATTTSIHTKPGDAYGISKSQIESLKEDLGDESKTGQVGTALYVAPEINSAPKAIYNQKVDIYSLGIIFFEMCYRPLATGMERNKILSKLRGKQVYLPEDFCEKNHRAQFLIKWLLNHDIAKRPTSQELLQSEHLPPPVLEEQELQEFVRLTLSNPQSKGYRYLISQCFKQVITPAQDITYDRDPTNPVATKLSMFLNVFNFVREICVKIFKQHGGQNLTTPLLMPKSSYCEKAESCVNLMTHFGNIVCLPHELRVPFARYVAWNNITPFRRYSVERVYKEKKVFGFLPRQFYVGAFDIVTPNKGSLMADAEILYIVYEIINELPGVRNKHFLIRLNHTALFEAILLHCGVRERHDELLTLLRDIKEGKVPKSQLQNFLIQRGLSDTMMHLLIGYLHSEIEISKVTNYFQAITKKKTGEASELAKTAIQELKTVVQNAEFYGVQFDIVVAPGFVSNIKLYSGMICEFVCDLKKKKRLDCKEVVAAGGRYDAMISYYRTVMDQTNMGYKDTPQSAVGISISLDRLVQAIQKQDKEELPKMEALDAIVCSVGSKQLIKEKTKILRSLWAAGVKCSLIEASNSVEVQEQLMELGVSYAIILKDNDQGFVRMRSWDKDSRELVIEESNSSRRV
ncbi:eIF-2-alpha kinase GCN2 isoform X1 [Euwallacea similis]|uniref:eIF-2-alpha kinase GCN2 isoform X1 n=1 Tax=Euwallacea similis TaxID=1736056 RepID=UPI00344B813C